jgi:chromosome segregation ATPase
MTTTLTTAEARTTLDQQRADLLAEIERLDADYAHLAGAAALSPATLPKLAATEARLAELRQQIARTDAMLAGLDREERAAREQAEAARIADLERQLAAAQERERAALQHIAGLLPALESAIVAAEACWSERATLCAALGRTPGQRAISRIEDHVFELLVRCGSRHAPRPWPSLRRRPLTPQDDEEPTEATA